MPKRILVVENDVLVRNGLVTVLARENYEVLEAAGVAEALNLLSRFDGTVNLLIADRSVISATGLRLADQFPGSRTGLRFLQISPELRANPEPESAAGSGAAANEFAARVKQILERPEAK